MSTWLLAALLAAQTPAQATAEKRLDLTGHLSVLADVLPRRDVAEVRPQASVEAEFKASRHVRLKFDGFIEGLAAKRDANVTTGIAKVREAWVEFAGAHADLRAGYGRIVWGRLDEFQPTDIVNPLDTARFIFDGRSAARLPVAFVRGRAFASERFSVEGILSPGYSPGTFDELDEPTSPFNLLADVQQPGLPVRQDKDPSWSRLSGGGRVQSTLGKVDTAFSIYRGFEAFRMVDVDPSNVLPFVTRVPRFTMIGADFETVTGDWAWRGEAAYFSDKSLARTAAPGVVKGHALDAGFGFDRRTGEYRVFGSVIVHREWTEEDAERGRTDVNLVGSVERQFRRDRYLVRAFAVVNPADASGFVRGLLVWRVGDRAAMEISAAIFPGRGDDTLARFRTRDFLMSRIRWRF